MKPLRILIKITYENWALSLLYVIEYNYIMVFYLVRIATVDTAHTNARWFTVKYTLHNTHALTMCICSLTSTTTTFIQNCYGHRSIVRMGGVEWVYVSGYEMCHEKLRSTKWEKHTQNDYYVALPPRGQLNQPVETVSKHWLRWINAFHIRKTLWQ